MPVILTLILSLIMLGCAVPPPPDNNLETNKVAPSPSSLPISPQAQMLESRTAYDENKLIAPDISGEYELETGTDNYKNVAKAHMIIEKLDDRNFGYYYAVQDEKAKASDGIFGIFRYKGGTFLNKVIDEGTTTTLNDNITLITEGQRLKLVVLRSYGKRVIIWSRVLEDGKKEDPILTEALADAKISYTQIYKEKFNELTEKEGH